MSALVIPVKAGIRFKTGAELSQTLVPHLVEIYLVPERMISTWLMNSDTDTPRTGDNLKIVLTLALFRP